MVVCALRFAFDKKADRLQKVLWKRCFLRSQGLFCSVLSKIVDLWLSCNVCEFCVCECVLNFCACAHIFVTSEIFLKKLFFIFFGGFFYNF